MRFYFFKVKYKGKTEAGYILTYEKIDRAHYLLMCIYGGEMELVELTETDRESYKQYIEQKYETPNTHHMQEIPSSLPGWRISDN